MRPVHATRTCDPYMRPVHAIRTCDPYMRSVHAIHNTFVKPTKMGNNTKGDGENEAKMEKHSGAILDGYGKVQASAWTCTFALTVGLIFARWQMDLPENSIPRGTEKKKKCKIS
ncbi:hypothetical protein POVWA2_011910 [Plasmodium ovale wallikeri]|uniref:Uncharacterized protein n=1 Tax=Plasmodium ovale wallikeri TaxID=864142 RepID=A0A1A8YMR1_PLAOA|nr:hypothetical protein POVWA2_011910 [Plasmodium ovale wallikeri]